MLYYYHFQQRIQYETGFPAVALIKLKYRNRYDPQLDERRALRDVATVGDNKSSCPGVKKIFMTR